VGGSSISDKMLTRAQTLYDIVQTFNVQCESLPFRPLEQELISISLLVLLLFFFFLSRRSLLKRLRLRHFKSDRD